jgi:hypothetical protein
LRIKSGSKAWKARFPNDNNPNWKLGECAFDCIGLRTTIPLTDRDAGRLPGFRILDRYSKGENIGKEIAAELSFPASH